MVYANRNGKYSEEVLIEEGRAVREKQVIARLPDPSKMRVVAKVNGRELIVFRWGRRLPLNWMLLLE